MVLTSKHGLQINRMKDKSVDAKDCVIYSEILTDIERVSDHIMNIIQECRRCSFTLTEDAFNENIQLNPAI